MPLRKLDDLLGASDELKTFAARTRRVQTLQTLYSECAPPELARSSRVKNYRAGTLSVCADNAAVAAKLRQLAPSLLASVRKIEPEVTVIRIGVQVSGALHERTRGPKKIALSAAALDSFAELSTRLGEGELRSALKRLVLRHKGAARRKGG